MLRPPPRESAFPRRATTSILTAGRNGQQKQPAVSTAPNTLAKYFDGTPPPAMSFALKNASLGEAEADTLNVKKLSVQREVFCANSAVAFDTERTSLAVEHLDGVERECQASLVVEGGQATGKAIISGLPLGSRVQSATLPIRLLPECEKTSSCCYNLLVFLQLSGSRAGRLQARTLIHPDQLGFDMILFNGPGDFFSNSDSETVEVCYWVTRSAIR